MWYPNVGQVGEALGMKTDLPTHFRVNFLLRANQSRTVPFLPFLAQVLNRATPAYSVTNLLHKELHTTLPVDLDADLILVDYGINDAGIEGFDLTTPDGVPTHDIRSVVMAHEVFVRYLLYDMVHEPAVVYVESFLAPAKAQQYPSHTLNIAEAHRNVTQKYDIPMVSQSLDCCVMRAR